MNVIRTYVPNSYQNYNHLVFCPRTRQAAAVDPFDAEHLKTLAKEHDLTINQIWITHEHGDHIRQLAVLQQSTGAQVYAPETCTGLFDANHWLTDGQTVQLGNSHITHWLSPGHTAGHGVFSYLDQQQPEDDFIICGDTLFNAGVGNTRSGDSATLYRTVQRLTALLTPSSKIYSGHDYIVTNLNFTLYHCPKLKAAQAALAAVIDQTPEARSVKTLADELTYNLFMRLDSPEVMKLTANSGPDEIHSQDRFLQLRSLRDQW